MLGNSIAFSQDSLTDSSKCFTIEEARTLLRYAEKGYLCDSLTLSYEKEIEILYKVIEENNDQLSIADTYIRVQSTEIDKLRKQKKYLTFGLGTSLIGLLVFVIL